MNYPHHIQSRPLENHRRKNQKAAYFTGDPAVFGRTGYQYCHAGADRAGRTPTSVFKKGRIDQNICFFHHPAGSTFRCLKPARPDIYAVHGLCLSSAISFCKLYNRDRDGRCFCYTVFDTSFQGSTRRTQPKIIA